MTSFRGLGSNPALVAIRNTPRDLRVHHGSVLDPRNGKDVPISSRTETVDRTCAETAELFARTAGQESAHPRHRLCDHLPGVSARVQVRLDAKPNGYYIWHRPGLINHRQPQCLFSGRHWSVPLPRILESLLNYNCGELSERELLKVADGPFVRLKAAEALWFVIGRCVRNFPSRGRTRACDPVGETKDRDGSFMPTVMTSLFAISKSARN